MLFHKAAMISLTLCSSESKPPKALAKYLTSYLKSLTWSSEGNTAPLPITVPRLQHTPNKVYGSTPQSNLLIFLQ